MDAAEVSGLSSLSGPVAGGTSVTITGTDFTGATAVDFGTTAATSFVVNSDTQITAVIPAGTGTVDVSVTTPSGDSATGASDQYTYVATPTVVSFTVNGSGTATGAASASESADGTTAFITAPGLAQLGFFPGELVFISGFTTQTGFNGTYIIMATSGNTFSYADALTGGVTDTGGTAYPALEQTNAGTLQVNEASMVDSLVVVFNEPVTIASPTTAFTLSLKTFTDNGTPSTVGDATTTVTATNPSGDGMTWVLTFSGGVGTNGSVVGGSIEDGDYYLNLSAGSVAATANSTITNASNQNSFYREFGDVLGTGFVTNPNYNRFKAAYGSLSTSDADYNAAFDYYASGFITNSAYNQFKLRYGDLWTGL